MAANTSQTLLERAAHDIGVAAQDVATADITGPWYSAALFRRVAAVAVSEELTTSDTMTVTLQQAEDSSGTNAKDLGSAVVATAGGAEAVIAEVTASVQDMDTGFTHVAVKLGASAAGTVAAAVLIRGDGRFRP